MKLKGRKYLKYIGGAIVVFAAAGAEYSVYKRGKRIHSPTPDLTFPPIEVTKVSAIMGHDLDKITRQAIDTIGGIKSIINPGDKVFIKPNAVGWGTSTP